MIQILCTTIVVYDKHIILYPMINKYISIKIVVVFVRFTVLLLHENKCVFIIAHAPQNVRMPKFIVLIRLAR